MTSPPADYYICPSCGTEFENDDFETTHEQLRAAWRDKGMTWFSRATQPPLNWNPYYQLFSAGLGYDLTTQDTAITRAEIRLETSEYQIGLLVTGVLATVPANSRTEFTV